MLFDLSNPYDCERAKTRLQSLIDKHSPSVEITEKTYRSGQQNKYMHVCIGIVAMETGNTIDYVKRYYFKAYCNPQLFLARHYDTHLRREVVTVKSSRDLTTEEMNTAIERFRNWAATEGWYIPTPEEEFLIRQAETEINKRKEYLWQTTTLSSASTLTWRQAVSQHSVPKPKGLKRPQ